MLLLEPWSYLPRNQRRGVFSHQAARASRPIKAKEWAVLNCPQHQAQQHQKSRGGPSRRQYHCPGCKKQFRSSASIKQLVVTRHPSPAEALEALEALEMLS
jgi:hypothetical protein